MHPLSPKSDAHNPDSERRSLWSANAWDTAGKCSDSAAPEARNVYRNRCAIVSSSVGATSATCRSYGAVENCLPGSINIPLLPELRSNRFAREFTSGIPSIRTPYDVAPTRLLHLFSKDHKPAAKFTAPLTRRELCPRIHRAHSDGASNRTRPLLLTVSRSLANPPTILQLPLTTTVPPGAATYP